MRTPFILAVWLLLSAGLAAQPRPGGTLRGAPPPLPAGGQPPLLRLLIKPQRGADLSAVHRRLGAISLKRLRRLGYDVVHYPPGRAVRSVLEEYRLSGLVEQAEEDVQYFPAWPSAPNDPEFQTQRQWGLHNEGTGPYSLSPFTTDIDAPQAWGILNSAPGVVVAVVDSGILYTHEDLADNLWRNPGESGNGRETNGLDDDQNGYVDDVYGINAQAGTGNPIDQEGHGTAVAGVIGARGNNGRGIAGVAWQVQLMACRASDGAGGYWLSHLLECLDYALAKGAHVINLSLGGPARSQMFFDALSEARAAGIPIVAAAGNASIGVNNDLRPTYPAGYELDNVVSVSACTPADELWDHGNYGQVSVDLLAPGVNIITTSSSAPDAYWVVAGTSLAAPHVSGALALLRARYPGDDYLQLINRLYSGVTRLDRSATYLTCVTGGRLNLHGALTATSAPANDAWDHGYLIPAKGTAVAVVASNRDGTKQPGEPAHAGNAGGRSVWWRWNPDFSGSVVISTEGSTFDTLLAVYLPAAGGPSAANRVGEDDDSAGDGNARLVVNVVSGSAYDIAVDGKNAAWGGIRLWVLPNPHTYAVKRGNTLGSQPNWAYAIDGAPRFDQLRAAGTSTVGGGATRAALWVNGLTTDLGTLGGLSSQALALNDAGQVVGKAQTASGVWRAFLFQGTMFDLGTLGGSWSEATAANHAGQVVGSSALVSGAARAFLWQNNTLTALPTLGGSEGYAAAINEAGQVVGRARTAAGTEHAFRWQEGVITDLLTLGGSSSAAYGVNAYGLIVGSSTLSNGAERACLWEDGAIQHLGTLGGGTSRALAVNNSGQVVGWATVSGGETRAFLWEQGHMYDLNSLLPPASGWVLRAAQAINQNGEIAGWGTFSGSAEAFVLLPTDLGFRATSLRADGEVASFDLTGPPGGEIRLSAGPDLLPIQGAWQLDPSTEVGYFDLNGDGRAYVEESLVPGTTRRLYSVMSSPAQIRAQRCPGFVSLSLPEGHSMISNPLDAFDSRTCRLLDGVPEGTIVYKYQTGLGFTVNSLEFGTWALLSEALQRGEGAIVRTPAGTGTTTVRLLGALVQGTLSTALPAGWSIVGPKLPTSLPLGAGWRFPLYPVDSVQRMNPGQNYSYTEFRLVNGAWSPYDPVLALGEGFWVSKPNPDEWIAYWSW